MIFLSLKYLKGLTIKSEQVSFSFKIHFFSFQDSQKLKNKNNQILNISKNKKTKQQNKTKQK